MNEKYNGWTNFETWLCNLWLTEWRLTGFDFFSEEEAEEAARVDDDDRFRFVCLLAERIQQQIEEFEDQQNCCYDLYADLLHASMARIDWYDIAESWLYDLVEEVKRNA